MKIENELLELALRAQHEISKNKQLPPGTDDAAIDAYEKRADLKVPKQLRTWLRLTNGPRVGTGGVFGIGTRQKFDDIEARSRDFPEWRRKKWIPVAGDGCGSFYVLATLRADGPGNPVFFIDHDNEPDQPTYVAASDYFHFLWFYLQVDLEETGWPFDRKQVLAKDPALKKYKRFPKGWELDE